MTQALLPFSPAWAAAFRDAIARDTAYREASSGWSWPMALVLDAAPTMGYDEAVAVELALDRGHCTAAQILHADVVTAPFVLRAAYGTWKQVVKGELDPLAGVTRGWIKVKGSLFTLLLHSRSARALCACARHVPTHFPDEPPSGA